MRDKDCVCARGFKKFFFLPTQVFDEKESNPVPWVSVDPDAPDLQQFPLFAHCTPIKVTVKAGDILYLPSLWYHQVGEKKKRKKKRNRR